MISFAEFLLPEAVDNIFVYLWRVQVEIKEFRGAVDGERKLQCEPPPVPGALISRKV